MIPTALQAYTSAMGIHFETGLLPTKHINNAFPLTMHRLNRLHLHPCFAPSILITFNTSVSCSVFTPSQCPRLPLLLICSSRLKSCSLTRMTLSEDPIEFRVRQQLAADGINLDELLNAGKVISLTRKLDNLIQLSSSLSPTSPEYQQLQNNITTVQKQLVHEKRQVMQQWLKRLFLAQALLFIVAGGALSNNAIPGYSVPLVGQALGFWMTWLFSIPALRARKGTDKWEKSALNLAFLATPLLNLTLPLLTKNCATIWAADVALLLVSYTFYAASAFRSATSPQPSDKHKKERVRVKGILKYLDWGSWR